MTNEPEQPELPMEGEEPKKRVRKAAKKSTRKKAAPKPKADDPEAEKREKPARKSAAKATEKSDEERLEPEEKPKRKPIVGKTRRVTVKASKEDQTEAEDEAGLSESGSEKREKKAEKATEPEREIRAEVESSPPSVKVPKEADLNEFRKKSLAEMYEVAEKLPIRIPANTDRAELAVAVMSCYLENGTKVTASGVLEQSKSAYGMLRDPERSFKNSADDIHVGGRLLGDLDLRVGQELKVLLSPPRNRDSFLSAVEVLEIDGKSAKDYEVPRSFDELTSLFPEERFILDGAQGSALAVRVVDLVAPIGKGQRGLIVAPPRGGKTILLKQIAQAIQQNHPETELIVLLLDERPEEVTDFEETVGSRVYASTFDEPSKRHAQVSDIVLERAKRLVESGKDVIILLDSLTRLARGYNNAISGGPIGSGGLSPKAIAETRKFFGAARNLEEGGSLTILATCLIETESRMDDVIFEELKGTGNMEVRLDQILAEQRIYPAIHLPQSGTRNDDRLYHPDEFAKVVEIRRMLAGLPVGEALETLLNRLSKTKSNPELLLKGMR